MIIYGTISTLIAAESKKGLADKAAPEIVHASGEGRDAFKENGLNLMWPMISNNQVDTEAN